MFSNDDEDDDRNQDLEALMAALTGAQARRRDAEGSSGGTRSTAGAVAAEALGLRGGLSNRTPPSPPAGLRSMLEAASAVGPRGGVGGFFGGSLLLVSASGGGFIGAVLEPSGQMALPMALMPPMGGEAAQANGRGRLLERALLTTMQQMMQAAAEQRSMEEQRSPPASETIRDALPRVVVTKEDQLDATNSKCAVCLDEYSPGARATRMFCGHLFCTGCIREWLRSANTCPVCRFELATDNAQYEEGRVERMRGRIARLRGGDLRMMRMPELKKLMRALGVSSDQCIEKAELISRLGNSPNVELAVDRSDLVYEEEELRALELPLLRNLMERHRIALPLGDLAESVERAEALLRFAEAGWLGSEKQKQIKDKLSIKKPAPLALTPVAATATSDLAKEQPTSPGSRAGSPASSVTSGHRRRLRSSLSFAGAAVTGGNGTAGVPPGASSLVSPSSSVAGSNSAMAPGSSATTPSGSRAAAASNTTTPSGSRRGSKALPSTDPAQRRRVDADRSSTRSMDRPGSSTSRPAGSTTAERSMDRPGSSTSRPAGSTTAERRCSTALSRGTGRSSTTPAADASTTGEAQGGSDVHRRRHTAAPTVARPKGGRRPSRSDE